MVGGMAKYDLNYLDPKKIKPFMHVETKTRYARTVNTPATAKVAIAE